MADSIKEKALQALTALIAGITVNDPVADPYGVVFSGVYREPLTDDQIKGKLAVATVLESMETKTERSYPVVDCDLQCYVEVHVFRQDGEVASQRVNLHLAAVEGMIRADRTIGGAVREVLFQGSDSTPEGVYSNYASGVLKMILQYRHHQEDTRTEI